MRSEFLTVVKVRRSMAGGSTVVYLEAMERNEISLHELKVFKAMVNADKWLSNHEIHALVDEVAIRTVRHQTKKLVDLGVVDQAEVFPAHRFRFSEHAKQRNRGYTDRLIAAAEVFDMDLEMPTAST